MSTKTISEVSISAREAYQQAARKRDDLVTERRAPFGTDDPKFEEMVAAGVAFHGAYRAVDRAEFEAYTDLQRGWAYERLVCRPGKLTWPGVVPEWCSGEVLVEEHDDDGNPATWFYGPTRKADVGPLVAKVAAYASIDLATDATAVSDLEIELVHGRSQMLIGSAAEARAIALVLLQTADDLEKATAESVKPAASGE